MKYIVLKVHVNFHTVCWDAVGCEWGATSIYFGITYVCFISIRIPVLTLGPQYQHCIFLFLSKVPFEGYTQSLKNIHVGCRFKTWMGFVGQISNWELLPFEVFFSCPFDALLGVTYANMLVVTQWPLKRAPFLTSPAGVFVVWRSESSLELSAPYCCANIFSMHWL